MINVVTILFESITTWLCLHIVFGKWVERKMSELMYIVIYVSIFALCSYDIIPKSFFAIVLLLSVIWSKFKFKYSIVNSAIRVFISYIMVGVLEVVSMYLMYPIVRGVDDVSIKCLFISFFMMSLLWIMILLCNKKKYNIKNIYIEKNIIIFTIIIFSLWLYIKFVFEFERRADLIYVFFFFVIVFSFLIMFKEQNISHELEKKNIQLQLNDVYGNAYEELIQVVRRRQHDYKNQLMAISAIHETASISNEIKDKQNKYVSILNKESQFDSILILCENSVIAGYLYSVCTKLFCDEIEVRYEVLVEKMEIDTKTKDIIEIIGILLNNAKETVELIDEKVIYLYLRGVNDKITIKVGNVSEYKSFSEIERMFSYGYSTKSNDRGIGLYSLKKIVDSYNGVINATNEEIDQKNYLMFSIEM